MPSSAPTWLTVLGDSLGLVLVVWSIPVALILIGAPIALAAAALGAVIRWIL